MYPNREGDGAVTRDAVVIPGISAASSVACLRSLGSRGVHTILVTERPDVPARYSKYCDEVVTTPPPADDLDSYRETLLELAKRPDVRTIIPLREIDVLVLAKHREEFEPHVATPWPTFETLRYAHDRKLLFEAAERANVPIPETKLLSAVDDWSVERIVKPRYGIVTSDYVPEVPENRVVSVGTTEHLDPGVAPDVATIQASMRHDPIVQEFVPGTEYCYRGLFDHGEVVSSSQKRLVRGIKYTRGPSIYHETVDIPALEEAGKALLKEIEWHGLASVGFIQDANTGEFKLLEINPRFWASLPMDIHAGADYPWHYWSFAKGHPERIIDHYEVGVGSHLLTGEVAHLHSVLFDDDSLTDRPSVHGTLWAQATSLVRQPHFDVFSLDDPRPFLRGFRRSVVQTASSDSDDEAPVDTAPADRDAAEPEAPPEA
ncbi:ATP-grasp domain-containing protein [Halorarius litoreus]|uniref:carboxylate--amine ligase n=1 Tax=Halorarius litoreus TaxID=2962676 RepID=UPI0020CBB48F|nr:ATP-grasp domain-containing protein [Halorarius litoreus]